MSDGTLRNWLEDIDLEEYIDKFVEIGAKKLKHLSDVTNDDLCSKIGLKELEVRRFKKKLAEMTEKMHKQESAEPSTSYGTKDKVCFPMPHSSFGHTVKNANEKYLRKEYKDVYFEAPEGLKQRTINDFILGMCAAAHWRFVTKRQLFDWARKERDMRWTMALTFMEREKIAKENKYFQGQSILCRLDILCKEFKDIKLMLDHEKPTTHQNKFDRVVTFADEINNIRMWAEDAKRQVCISLEAVTAKQGRKEEETYWRKFNSNVENVVQEVQSLYQKARSLENKFRLNLGHSDGVSERSTMREKCASQHKVKNSKKAVKRKASRAELVAESGITSKKMKSRLQLNVSTLLPHSSGLLYHDVHVHFKCTCYRSYE